MSGDCGSPCARANRRGIRQIPISSAEQHELKSAYLRRFGSMEHQGWHSASTIATVTGSNP